MSESIPTKKHGNIGWTVGRHRTWITVEKSTVQYNNEWHFANPVDIKKAVENDIMFKIDKAIPEGEENAITRAQLKERIGYKNDRKLRSIIKEMRDSGEYIILASDKGYWKPKVPTDVIEWATYMRSYIQDISHTVKVVEDSAVKKWGEKYYQLPMDLN